MINIHITAKQNEPFDISPVPVQEVKLCQNDVPLITAKNEKN